MSLIIGAIVILVMTAFSLIVLQSQKIALQNRTTQMCYVLVQNLAESVKGDLLLGKTEKVREAVYRLQKNTIDGLQQVAIFNHKVDVVAEFIQGSDSLVIDNRAEISQFTKFTSREREDQFDFYHPIVTELQENNQVKRIKLGTAYIRFSKESIVTPINHARNIAIGTAMFIILFSSIGIHLISRKMARQIQMLSNGARAVGSGNLNVQISVSSKDELGLLAAEFNSMIQQLREKGHMQKFMSKLTVDMIKDTVRTRGKDLKATKRNVAVLFSDVRNFSSISELLAPEEIVKLVNVYFDLQTRIIEQYHGIVDKFMGDQIMAIFQGRNMADGVLRAAVEIQRQVRTLNQERSGKGKVTMDIGIGINNGAAVMGHMGSASRMDYTVIGDVVNVAARLCSSAKAGQIITSLELAHKVNGSYPTSRLKSIAVKGRSQVIEVCEVDYDRDILL
ncbi:MAG TPA: adenylate/guanylate cyclase domain-containing protein [bacterium]